MIELFALPFGFLKQFNGYFLIKMKAVIRLCFLNEKFFEKEKKRTKKFKCTVSGVNFLILISNVSVQ